MNPSALFPCVLDTNILVNYLRANDLGVWIENNYHLQTTESPSFISAVTVGEIRSLANRFGWTQEKKNTLQILLNAFYIVPIDTEPIYQAYEAIDDYSLKNGRKMGKNDLWIAATSKALGALLLTTDKDFDRLHPSIIKRNYLDPDNPQNWKIIR